MNPEVHLGQCSHLEKWSIDMNIIEYWRILQ